MEYLKDLSKTVIRAKSPSKSERALKFTLLLFGLIFSINFIHWYLRPDHQGYGLLYWLLFFSFSYEIVRLWMEWYFSVSIRLPASKEIVKKWEVDVLTTYARGEPKDMLKNTLRAIKNIKYPHTSFLCDEEDDPELRQLCEDWGIHHVTREDKKDAKAGNINNALSTRARGEICLILDPDHVPHPDFLHDVLPQFEDEKIGFVQVVQAYYNHNHSVVSRAAAEQTYLFYGPFMSGLNRLGCVPAIGANCTFRRSALDDIGGHASGLTEDMHTSMLLHAKGWKSIYVPGVVSKGLVPWNFSGYCKQQLKWARGTFDLLFRVYPRVFTSLTLHQKIFYLIAPLFYLYGLKSLIDFAVPIAALLFQRVPLEIELLDFFVHYLPIFLIALIFRFFNQRWLYEPHEKGIFLLGGILLKNSWWVAMTGLLYAIVGKKVPYIPTPKEVSMESPWRLLIPNFIIIILSLFAIVYGLHVDFQPMSLFMAGFSMLNILILSFGSLMALQTLVVAFHQRFPKSFISKNSVFRQKFWHIRHNIYNHVSYSSGILSAITIVSFLTALYFFHNPSIPNPANTPYFKKSIGKDHFQGVPYHLVTENASITPNYDFVVIEIDLHNMADASWDVKIDRVYELGRIPYIRIISDSITDQQILAGAWDRFLYELFDRTSGIYLPVFIQYENADEHYIPEIRPDTNEFRDEALLAYAYIARYCRDHAMDHVAWVGGLRNSLDLRRIEKSMDFLSWLYIDPHSIHAGEDSIRMLTKVLTELGCALIIENDGYATEKLKGDSRVQAFAPMCRAFVSRQPTSLSTFKTEEASIMDKNSRRLNRNSWGGEKRRDSSEQGLQLGSNDLKSRTVGLSYIKGISYNPGQHWRDDKKSIVLSSRKLEKDFHLIKEMGSNTIRRYAPGFYDRNIFLACDKANLKILYGFWFDPGIDYYKDQRKVRKLIGQTLKVVQKHMDKKAILAWVPGNETWGLLGYQFNEPYLSLVRQSYARMIETIAEEIKAMDPERPVITCSGHSPHLASELKSLYELTPSLDAIGINSYYEEDLSELDDLVLKWYPGKPYLVSEFGPKGYWHPVYSDFIQEGIVAEMTSHEKAMAYQHHWQNYIARFDQNNLGGVAYCWQDRYQGSATWYGISDLEGNLKPSYFALKSLWTQSEPYSFPVPNYHIVGPVGLLSPGASHQFRAVSLYEHTQPLSFTWILYEDFTFRKIAESGYGQNSPTFVVKVPTKPANYRLHVFVKDQHSHLVSTSRAIPVDWTQAF